MNPDDAKFRDQIAVFAKDASECNIGSPKFQNACRKLAVLSWHFLTPDERHTFLGRCDPLTMEFDLTPIGIDSMLRTWDIVMEFLPSGWDGKFAKDVNTRRHKKWWKPKPSQEVHIRRIWQTALDLKNELKMEEAGALDVLEDPEDDGGLSAQG